MENKEVNNNIKRKKIVIKDKKKFMKSIIVFILVVIVIVFFCLLCNKKVVIDDTTNIVELKTKKYSKQIKEYYELQGMEDKFVEEYNTLLNNLWTYIYNNIDGEKSLEDVASQVNEILSTDDWSSLGIQKSTTWKGVWTIDVTNNTLKFKFENSDIEPSWIENDTVNYIIEKN